MLRAPAIIAVLALTVGACAQAEPTGFRSGGDDEVVLRVSVGGGFVPHEVALSEMPWFTLYGDGRLITVGAQIEIYPQPALPPLVVRSVTDRAIGQIVAAARDAGLDEDNAYRNDMIADAPTTTFTLTVDGTTTTTSAYALDFDPERDPDSPEGKLAAFHTSLGDLPSWIDEADLGDEGSWTADAVRLWVGAYQPNEELPQRAKDWPLDELLSEHLPTDDALYGCTTVDGADATSVLAAAADANQLTPWTSDGEDYAVVFRPLLPDESGCPN